MLRELAGLPAARGRAGREAGRRRGARRRDHERVARLALDLADDVAELDVNPLVVKPRGAVALDALVVKTTKETDVSDAPTSTRSCSPDDRERGPLADAQPARRRERDHARGAQPHHRAPRPTRTTSFDVRAVVLTAAGEKHFCTGADLRAGRRRAAAEARGRCPSGITGDAARMIRTGIQRLVSAVPRLREADHRRGQRHRGRRRRRHGPRLRPRDRGRARPAHPGVRAARPHPRRRPDVPAPPARRAPEGEGARVLRRRPPRGRSRAHRPRQQGRAGGGSRVDRARVGRAARARARRRRSGSPSDSSTARSTSTAPRCSSRSRSSSSSSAGRATPAEGVASFVERRPTEFKGW